MGEWWKEVNTPSVSNYVVSIFLESQNILSLTKIIEKITKTYDIKLVSYENIINEESKDTYLVL
jgi:ABC-type xylose transport system substrate-binding protein